MTERNLVLRVVSALVGLPLIGLAVFWPSPLPFALLVLAAAILALYELGRLTLGSSSRGSRCALIALGLAFAIAVYLGPGRAFAWMVAVLVLAAIHVLLTHGGELSTAIDRLGRTVFGVFYVGGLLSALALLRRDLPWGALWVATAVMVTFANDTGAYLVGRTLGRHKLAPAISPGKTVEGAIGGLCIDVGAMFIARATFFPALKLGDAIAIGIVAGVLGPVGDLLESMIKRAAGAKDSGRVIPGHGGILDRIDALMFVAAYVYLHARYLHPAL